MKNLKILIFLCISLSFQSFAKDNKKLPGFIKDKNGCMYFTSDTVGKSVEWSGECKDGFAHGNGNLKVFKNKKYLYGGHVNLAIGKMEGEAEIIEGDGGKYVGNVVSGKYSGKGIYTSKTGYKFEGIWENMDTCKKCIMTDPSGKSESGETINGKWKAQLLANQNSPPDFQVKQNKSAETPPNEKSKLNKLEQILDFELGTQAAFTDFGEDGGLNSESRWYGIDISNMEIQWSAKDGKPKFIALIPNRLNTIKQIRNAINLFCNLQESDWVKENIVAGRRAESTAKNQKCNASYNNFLRGDGILNILISKPEIN